MQEDRNNDRGGRSTVEIGDSFRDHVCRLLAAAGFHGITTESRELFKKADASLWASNTILGRLRLIEAKDYSGNLPKSECIEFVTEYRTLIENRVANHAWLVSKGPIAADGRALIEANEHHNLKCFTYAELQRHLFQVDGYVLELLDQFNRSDISKFYVRPRIEEDQDLEAVVIAWLNSPNEPPLAIIGGYGTGKSTFALSLAASLARQSINDATKGSLFWFPWAKLSMSRRSMG